MAASCYRKGFVAAGIDGARARAWDCRSEVEDGQIEEGMREMFGVGQAARQLGVMKRG